MKAALKGRYLRTIREGGDLLNLDPEAVQSCINVMIRVVVMERGFNIYAWRSDLEGADEESVNVDQMEEEVHSCGTSACFGGWLAVSPEFRGAGGKATRIGSPIMDHISGSGAIGNFASKGKSTCNALSMLADPCSGAWIGFMGTPSAQDVLDRLLIIQDAMIDQNLATTLDLWDQYAENPTEQNHNAALFAPYS
jgi:hypothetical protein